MTEPKLSIVDLTKRYAAGLEPAVDRLNMEVEEGHLVALLGPSGCGKTTLLNIVSGLLRPSEGALLIDGKDLTTAPPEARNIAQVFQFPVLYDTMTVFENLLFPLKNRKVEPRAARARVHKIASLLELDGVLEKRARSLSAELKQRISLGRGLVREDVAAILFDEPLTVIDPHVKWQLRSMLKELHQRIGRTMIYVTHDQTEALTLADEVVVMSQGRVLQQGTPAELFERPAHTFVGYFIGSPGMNLWPCTIEGDAAVVDGQPIPLAPELAQKARALRGPYVLGVRPELARLHDARVDAPGLAATVHRVEHLGSSRTVFAHAGTHEVAVKLYDDRADPREGAACFVALPPERTILYADGNAIT